MKKDFGILFRHIMFNVNSFIGLQVQTFGIKQGQMDYFLQIASCPGINQMELAKLKNVGKASVTKALKILEGDGFIKRIADESDLRNTKCFISDKGEEIVAELMKIKAVTQEKLFLGFKHEEKEAFFDYLSRLDRNSCLIANQPSEDKEEK